MENFFKLSPQDYIKATEHADMNNEYRFFEPFLNPGDKILDVGFGSGRDMVYFKNKGYDITGIEIEPEFVEYGLKLGLNVKTINIMNYQPKELYDAIWACASLVHVPSEELPEVFAKLKSLVKPGGIIYCSFKYGTWEGYIAERYYTYLTEEKLKEFNLDIVKVQVNQDSLNRDHNWISFIFKNN